MLIQPKKEYVGYKNYQIHQYIEFEANNFNSNLALELVQLTSRFLYNGRISRLRIDFSAGGKSKYIDVDSFDEIKNILHSFEFHKIYAVGFIKENSLHYDNEIVDFSIYYMANNVVDFTIQGYCKDHLEEFYEFFSNLQFFKDNNIDFLKMSMINPKLDDFVENYFRKLFNETGKLEYRDVASGNFNITTGINWTCLESPTSDSFRRLMRNKTFGSLPLFPFPDYSYLEDLGIFKLTHFKNGVCWLQLTEDVCPWDDDPAYIQALHTFVDAYIEKRDEYFYSLPIEVQNEMLGNLKPNS